MNEWFFHYRGKDVFLPFSFWFSLFSYKKGKRKAGGELIIISSQGRRGNKLRVLNILKENFFFANCDSSLRKMEKFSSTELNGDLGYNLDME